ncbi:MAG TPA: hypothetical protein VNZ49_00105 [Bacteroidia bacterium]|jgi:hypothetical protein|nr:hypothetical protein [Bacteroidia bacterium]
MKRFLLFTFLLAGCHNSENTDDPQKRNATIPFILGQKSTVQVTPSSDMHVTLVNQAYEMMNSYLKTDFKKFVSKVYPGLVSKEGGENNMIFELKISSAGSKDGETSIDTMYAAGVHNIINTGNQMQTTLSRITIVTVPDGKMITVSMLIAISEDNGQNWSFLDANGRDIKSMKESFPELSDKLVLLPDGKPIYIRY